MRGKINTKPSRGRASVDRNAYPSLLQREHVSDHRLDVPVAHLRIRRHRHRSPDAGSALLDLLLQLASGGGIAAVFLGHIHVRRTDDLLVDRMTSGAAVLLEEVLAGLRERRTSD